MLVFRSEDHLDEWLRAEHPRGEEMTLSQQWDLAKHWFAGRHLPGWNKRTPEEAAEIFGGVGLTSEFWSLA